MTPTCSFCGSTERPRGKEHVFPAWLRTTGLPTPLSELGNGRINRLPRTWPGKPFTTTVGGVCDACNHGWLSQMEELTKPVLVSLIKGISCQLSPSEQAIVACWAWKTALVSMLQVDATAGDGLSGVPRREYGAVRSAWSRREPGARVQVWVGRVGSTAEPSIGVVPITLPRAPDPSTPLPDGYVFTVQLGSLIIQGIRYTAPKLTLRLRHLLILERIWPTTRDLDWPTESALDDRAAARVRRPNSVSLAYGETALRPWAPAVNVETGSIDGRLASQPMLCGKHFVYYPVELGLLAIHETRSFAFMTSCECNVAYMVTAEPDCIHFRKYGQAEDVALAYESLEGEEFAIKDENGSFYFKHISSWELAQPQGEFPGRVRGEGVSEP